jgi:hypothetical protein
MTTVPLPRQNNPDLLLEFCSAGDKRYREIRSRHYVDSRGTQGQQIHFLIWYKGAIVGIISGASAVYRHAGRDKFFGITSANRNKVLNGIISNTAFRLEVRVPNLASQVLSLWRKVVPPFWEHLYGVKVFGFETFVDTDTDGGCYKADNWTNCTEGDNS